jgi:steroid delta-isomerase-like uncharacterized protein
MSTEQNKSITRRWIEQGWNQGNLAVINEIYDPNFLQHEPEPATVNSAEALKHYVGAFRNGMPDLHFSIDDLIAEGDKVVWRFTATGTHQAELWGIPPTGKKSTVTGIVEFRFANSRIAEAWVNFDTLGMLQQMGIIPVMGA